ncbi:1-phosphofructokinase [Tepidibacter hydrothermalis]|uniref:Tagatose-6-phosphate kinase n=1 Tax=Tepidibacter hydrothermalis TaxID=3036126 RepID=A0ABY8EE19_9FIRM|nr:1-phosphofructokinase [Tepidibacter hydrothermalis]WFD11181.1 1-phosphofructokinase [Tepidibacter hydrothermalis]
MIYTVTFNPAIDYIVNVSHFKTGEVNRVNSDIKYPGGKGINVSRVLNNFGVDTKALGFIGGFTGNFIKNYIEDEGVKTDFINVKEDTRINVKLKSNEETEINGYGPTITEENLNSLFDKIKKLNSEDILVLAGNVQKSVPRDIYAQIQNICIKNNVKVVVDTTGEALLNTLKNKPFLIKPNKYELSEMLNVDIDNMDDIIHYAKKLIDMGAQNVIISMAGDGALLICNEGVYKATTPNGAVKNSVGAGDSLIAGFLASYYKEEDILKAFKLSVATGSATAFSLDLCTKEYAMSLINQVDIKKIS